MKNVSRLSRGVVAAGLLFSVAAFATTSGATGLTGTYNAADAKLVPSALMGKTLQVATDASYAPDEFMSGTKMVGFDVDLINAIGVTLGVKVKENNVTFDNILAGIQSGRYQIGNSSFTDNKSRESTNNFVDYFQAGEGVYAKASSKVTFTGLASFCGYKVAVESGTTEKTDAQAQAAKCPSGKKLTVMQFANQTEANTAVSSGQSTFGFLDSQVASYVVKQSNGVFKNVGSAVNVAPYGIATAKTSQGLALAKAIQAALKTLIANGTYKAIMSKWGVTAGSLTAAKIVLNGALS